MDLPPIPERSATGGVDGRGIAPSTSPVVCLCAKEIVIDGLGWRSTERDPTVDRVWCEATPGRHHRPAPAGDAALRSISPPWSKSGPETTFTTGDLS